jgi:YgiT-type zinc finger domain-containing protein
VARNEVVQMAESTVETELVAVLSAWQAGHPEATLSDLEAVLDQHLDAVRASVLSTAASACPAATTCPECGAPLRRRGTRSRKLLTHGGEALALERAYLTCPACGDGLFPPG